MKLIANYDSGWNKSSDFETENRVPMVSVLLPVFNADRYIEKAIRSVLDQSFQDFELLVLDDGSVDKSLEIIKNLFQQDKRIRWRSRDNCGLIVTLNELLSEARGELIARMDADDWCHPERFSLQVEYLKCNPDTIAVGTRITFIDEEGDTLAEAMDRYSHEEIDSELLKPGFAIVHPSVMVRTEKCRSIGGFRTAYKHAEDLDFFLRLSEVGKLANLSRSMLYYRVHSSSVSHLHVVEQSVSASRAVNDALRRRGLSCSDSEPKKCHISEFESKAQLHRKWAWWAFNAANLNTARKHAIAAMRLAPISIHNWRLLATVALALLKSKSS